MLSANIENGVGAGIDDNDGKSTSQYAYSLYVDDMGVVTTSQTHGNGPFDTQDRAMLLEGWVAYSALSANSGGPYLAGMRETIFCTGEAGCDSYGGYAGNTPVSGGDINTTRAAWQIASAVRRMLFGARSTTERMMTLRLSMITCIMVGTPIRTLRVCVLITLMSGKKLDARILDIAMEGIWQKDLVSCNANGISST